MAKKFNLVRGTHDCIAADMAARQYVIDCMRKTAQLHGFAPMSTPSLELTATIEAMQFGQEKLMYSFKDKSERSLSLRYDQTVPLGRVVSMYEMPMPFKRFQCGSVWRADRPGKGRYREFTQFDVDIVGDSTNSADAEIMGLILSVFNMLSMPVVLKYNDRRCIERILECHKVDKQKYQDVMRVLDKIDKIQKEGVLEELADILEDDTQAENIMKALSKAAEDGPAVGPCNMYWLERAVRSYLPDEYQKQVEVRFDPFLMRGLSYYDGVIFEIFPRDCDIGAICAGGRYDRLFKDPRGKQLPSIGASFGIERCVIAWEAQEKSLLPMPSALCLVRHAYTCREMYCVPAELHRLREDGISASLISCSPLEEYAPLKCASYALDHAIRTETPFLLEISRCGAYKLDVLGVAGRTWIGDKEVCRFPGSVLEVIKEGTDIADVCYCIKEYANRTYAQV